MFRDSSAEATALSDYLRSGSDGFVRARRRVATLYLTGTAALGVVALYQMGVMKHVPEPRLRFLDADRVDASGEAYATMRMPDAVLGILSNAVTLALVTSGGKDRVTSHPWLPISAAAKVLFDAVSGGVLTAEQSVRHRAFCSWCLGAAAASALSVSMTLPEAAAAARGFLTRARMAGS